ncbi:potassium-transporting ATPase subunit KdpC [Geminicoccus roseus]|uniref:potassium-transporting ATPase subunit KdpC n=1 Tax=Geminicoccus roseus TaxID=404900 RepID=UPI00042868B2|nr:potassium-transporting ATPase subunit KdpC [Geminicoccus roseus]
MMDHVRPALVLLLAFTALTGVAYPLVITGIAQGLFPAEANGSLVVKDGRVVGSGLIGQAFTDPGYFHGRPSAAGTGYDAAASSGSNLAPTSARLAERLQADVQALRGDGVAATIPADLVTSSASGLDPHLSPAAALLQAPRVASARGVATTAVEALVRGQVEQREVGILGEERVNVLMLNLALDQTYPRRPAAPDAGLGTS